VAARQNYSASTNVGLILLKLNTFSAYSTCLFLEEFLRTEIWNCYQLLNCWILIIIIINKTIWSTPGLFRLHGFCSVPAPFHHVFVTTSLHFVIYTLFKPGYRPHYLETMPGEPHVWNTMFSYFALKAYVHCPGKFTIDQTAALEVVHKVRDHEHVFMSVVTNVYCTT